MKRINFLPKIALIVTFGVLFIANACLHDKRHSKVRSYNIPGDISDQIRTDMSYNNLKAVSLRELQKKIRYDSARDIDEIKSFYGITRLYGFLWDTKGNDLILFGEADKTKKSLNFDDFVASLRNVYYLYCDRVGNTIYYTCPSCTIDPDPNTIKMLNNLDDYDSGDNPDKKGRSWEEICTHPQSVKVFGLPFNSHLASLIVNADYLLKDIANGNMKLEIEGDFKSLHQIRRDIVEESMKSDIPVDLGSPMNRFEFTAPTAYFSNSENLYLLYSIPIVLITEEEYISQNSISGTGNPDPLAKKFADNFSLEYQNISKGLPIYESLLQSYRIFAIAKAIEESELIADTSFFSEIFNHYSLDEVNVPKALPGKSMVDKITYNTSERYFTHYLYSCGGVNLASKAKKSPVKRMKEMEIINSIILTRPSAETVEWNARKVHSNYWILNINRIDYIRDMFLLIN